jgi:hypothetical protein
MKRSVRDDGKNHKTALLKLFIFLQSKVIRFGLVSTAKGLGGIKEKNGEVGFTTVPQVEGLVVCDQFTKQREYKCYAKDA